MFKCLITLLRSSGRVPESTTTSLGHDAEVGVGGPGPYAGCTAPSQPQRRGALQLWQFLVTLLDDPNNSSCIVWTGRGMEFKLVEPEEVKHNIFIYTISTTNIYLPAIILHRKENCLGWILGATEAWYSKT